MKHLVPCLFLLLFLPFEASANGGIIDASLFRKTKNIQLLRKADISLLKEDLRIKVIGDQTVVQVEYTIRNNGAADEMLYGFPVDAFEGTKYGDYIHKDPFHKLWKRTENMKIIDYFTAFDSKGELRVKDRVVDSIYVAEGYPVYRKWHVIQLHFEKGETKSLSIKYKVTNTKRDVSTHAPIPEQTKRHFMYDLTPSSSWGDGRVGEFSLEIDLNALPAGTGYTVSGIPDLVKHGDRRHSYWEADYDLNRADRILISYEPSPDKMLNHTSDYSLPRRMVKSIRVSNNQASAQYLLDNDPRTYWTGRVGDWIELELDAEIPRRNPINGKTSYRKISAIMALNGCYSSFLDFHNNGKIKGYEILINDTLKYNADWMDYRKGKTGNVINLKPPPYVEMPDMRGSSVVLADGNELSNTAWNKTVTKVRITIRGIREGFAETDDCAISELYLFGY